MKKDIEMRVLSWQKAAAINPVATVIIPCYNSVRFTILCAASVLRYTHIPFELIIIDNGSSDGTSRYLRAVSAYLEGRNPYLESFHAVLNAENRGVAAALNQGIHMARGRYLCYLNNDTIVTEGWLERLVSCMDADLRIGIAGCCTNDPVNQRGGLPLVPGLRSVKEIQRTAALHALKYAGAVEDACFVHGFCMCIRKEAIDAIGLFDERFYPCGGEDLDLSLRAEEAGFRIVNTRSVFVFHFQSKATTSENFKKTYNRIGVIARDAERTFMEKWGEKGARFLQRIDAYKELKHRKLRGG